MGDREATAERLLRSSARLSYDPDVDVHWAAPLNDDQFFVPEKLVSLYGTPLWDTLTRAQRIELSRQELVNTVSVGIWFELILMQMLLRASYGQDPTTRHVHYALTEVADECRHSTMFATLIERVGGRPYRNHRWLQLSAQALPVILHGPAMWVATLIGEEIFDALQREHLDDESVQPVVRAVMRIHVTEEARHVRYAREDLVRELAGAPWWRKEFARIVVAVGALLMSRLLSRPRQYLRAGIDPGVAVRAARQSAHRREMLTFGARKLVRFLRENDLIGGPSAVLWRRAGMLGTEGKP